MRNNKLNLMMKISLLATMAIILQQISMPIAVLFPEFLKIDLSDVPALIGGFAFGPLAGVMVMFIKNVVHGLISSQTLWVGEFANFVIGSSIVVVSASIYKHRRNKKNAIIGLIAGTTVMALVGALMNYFVLLPLYSKVMGIPVEGFVEIGSAINPMVKSLWGYILIMIVPFNILKGAISTGVVMVMYKSLSGVLKREHQKISSMKKI